MVEIDMTNFNLKKKIVLDKWGEILKLEMIDRVPKEYGTMAASIETEREGDEVSVGTKGTPYAVYVEYGTGSMTNIHGEFPKLITSNRLGESRLTSPPIIKWAALEKRREVGSGQTMPFAQTASFFTEDERIRVLKEAFK